MNLFYREFDSNQPIVTGAFHLSAAAARLAVSLLRSLQHLDDAAWAELRRILTANSVWGLCLVLAGWFVATVIGGPVGWCINALLFAFGLPELWDRLTRSWDSLKQWFSAAYHAQNDGELDVAAKHCADVLAVGGVAALEFVLTHRVFKLAESQLVRRFPTPAWLRGQYEEAVRLREKQKRAAAEQSPKENLSALERAKATAERLKRLPEEHPALRYEGGKHLAAEFPTGAVVTGVLATAAGLGFLAWIVSAEPRGRGR